MMADDFLGHTAKSSSETVKAQKAQKMEGQTAPLVDKVLHHRPGATEEINRLCDLRLVVEIKACRSLIDDHVAQLLGYLRASRIELGLLINFGGPKLQIKKYILDRSS